MQNLANDIIAIAVDQEIDAAGVLLDGELKQAEKKQAEAEAASIEAKRAEQQAIFRKDIDPAIKLVEALVSAGLTDPDFAKITDNKSSFRVNSGVALGYRYKLAVLTPKGDMKLMNARSREECHHKDVFDDIHRFDAHIKENKNHNSDNAELVLGAPKTNKPDRVLTKHYAQSSDEDFIVLGGFFEPYSPYVSEKEVLAHLRSHGRDPRINTNYYSSEKEKKGAFKAVFMGAEFERGKTSPEDVNQFITSLVKTLYERDKHKPDNLEKLRKILKKQFKIDLDSVTESARMLVVARNFRASADSGIAMAKSTTQLDLSVLNQTPDDIRTEIARAKESSDALAILKIGENVLDVSRMLISQLANDMLPAAMGDDYRLLQSIKKDLADLKPADGATKKQTIGERLWSTMRRSANSAMADDPNAAISTNFTALTASLTQRREVVQRRVSAIQSKSEAIQKLCDLIEVYKEEIDKVLESETDAIKANDLKELREIFAINAIATNSSRQGIVSAVSSEKKAFLAIQKTSNVIPLLAASLIQAINKIRKGQANSMLAGSEQATHIMLEDLAENATLSASAVFELADKHLGLIEGHVQEAGRHLKDSESAIQQSALEAQEHLLDNS